MASGATSDQRRRHWDDIYTRDVEQLSWFEHDPAVSLELIESLGVPDTAPIVDVGGGASALGGALVARGFEDVSVLDVSAGAIGAARSRLGPLAGAVQWLHEDLLEWEPRRHYGLWHDRAVFHFLVEAADRRRYREVLRRAVAAGGAAVVATFAPDGPDSCSGLATARYGAEALVDALGAGFELVISRRDEHTTPAGAVQPFTWVAVRRGSE